MHFYLFFIYNIIHLLHISSFNLQLFSRKIFWGKKSMPPQFSAWLSIYSGLFIIKLLPYQIQSKRESYLSDIQGVLYKQYSFTAGWRANLMLILLINFVCPIIRRSYDIITSKLVFMKLRRNIFMRKFLKIFILRKFDQSFLVGLRIRFVRRIFPLKWIDRVIPKNICKLTFLFSSILINIERCLSFL